MAVHCGPGHREPEKITVAEAVSEWPEVRSQVRPGSLWYFSLGLINSSLAPEPAFQENDSPIFLSRLDLPRTDPEDAEEGGVCRAVPARKSSRVTCSSRHGLVSEPCPVGSLATFLGCNLTVGTGSGDCFPEASRPP